MYVHAYNVQIAVRGIMDVITSSKDVLHFPRATEKVIATPVWISNVHYTQCIKKQLDGTNNTMTILLFFRVLPVLSLMLNLMLSCVLDSERFCV